MKNIRVFLSENFQFLEVKFSIYLNRHVFVMGTNKETTHIKHILNHRRPNKEELQQKNRLGTVIRQTTCGGWGSAAWGLN